MVLRPSSSRVKSVMDLYCCRLLSCQLIPQIVIFLLCLPQEFKAMQSIATQRNTTTTWYETRNNLIPTCNTNDQAKQCNSTRYIINKWTDQCRQPQASKPSHCPPFENIRTNHQNDQGVFLISLTDVGVAHLHTAVTERSQCSATGRLTLATQRQATDCQGNQVRHCPHRLESWDSRRVCCQLFGNCWRPGKRR